MAKKIKDMDGEQIESPETETKLPKVSVSQETNVESESEAEDVDIKKLSLYEKLLKIMEEMGTVTKSGHNSHHRYDYIKESDIAIKMQQLLVKYRVLVLSSIQNVAPEKIERQGQSPARYVLVTSRYTFLNVDNPKDTHEIFACGEGIDTGDKAFYKASTGMNKYMIIRNFMLGSDEDPEKDNEMDKDRMPLQAYLPSQAQATRQPRSKGQTDRGGFGF